MDKDRKQQKKELDSLYLDFYYQTKRRVREKNLNLYAQREVNDALFDKIYEAFKSGEKVDRSLGKDKEKTIEKVCKGKPRKNLFEVVTDTTFLFSTCMALLTLFLYIMNFFAGNEQSYNKGIEMYYQSGTYFYVILFAVIMFGVFTIMNKITMNMTWKSYNQIVNLVFLGFFSVVAVILYVLGNRIICLNFVVLMIVFILLIGAGYLLSRWSFKKHYAEYLEKRNAQKETKE